MTTESLASPVIAGAGHPGTAQLTRSAPVGRAAPLILATNLATEFVLKPVTMTPYGNGIAVSTVIGQLTTTQGAPITWTKWTRKQALGPATTWLNDMTPSLAEGHWDGYPVKLKACRVVRGRCTRLTLHGKENAKNRTANMRLVHVSPPSPGMHGGPTDECRLDGPSIPPITGTTGQPRSGVSSPRWRGASRIAG